MRRHLRASEVRGLPIGSKVRICSYDKYGYPQWLDCEVVQAGRHKELRFDSYDGFGRRPIRSGVTYMVEVADDG